MKKTLTSQPIGLILFLTAMPIQRGSGSHMAIQLSHLKLACELAGDLKNTAPNAAFQLNKRATAAGELQVLKEDLTLLALKPEHSTNSELKLIAELARAQVAKTLKMLKTETTKAIQLVGSAATLAGRIDDLARLMLLQGQGDQSTCVSTSTSFTAATAAAATLPGCTETSAHTASLPGREATAHAIDIKTKFEAVPSTTGGVTSGGTSCIILHHGASSGLGQADAAASLLGGLLEQGSGTSNAPTWKGGNRNLGTTGSAYAAVDRMHKQFMADISQYDDINSKLLKLAGQEPSSAEAIVIEGGAIYDKHPKQKTTISQAAAEAIRRMIESHRKELQGDKLKKERDAFFLKQLETNITACEVGAKTNPKENCELTKAQTAACNAKEEGECGKTPGCEWNKTEGKCENTENEKKTAEKANQETGGNDGKATNTTGSNSFVIHKAPLLLAVLFCN
uniref:Variant surface glycoprotein 666 n=1 Tax=Trypanosoma brucei TaxID=5691 RepID=M4T0N7_9TRYP|nr:variant surface glycoprotein 666 [Trypanosoma brucei]